MSSSFQTATVTSPVEFTSKQIKEYHTALTDESKVSPSNIQTSQTKLVSQNVSYEAFSVDISERSTSTNTASYEQQKLSTSTVDLTNLRRDVVRQSWSTEVDRLVEERNKLVGKKFQDGISSKEARRLNYIVWQLDQIDDSVAGEHLDQLESIAQAHAQLAQTVKELVSQVEQLVPKKSKHRDGWR